MLPGYAGCRCAFAARRDTAGSTVQSGPRPVPILLPPILLPPILLAGVLAAALIVLLHAPLHASLTSAGPADIHAVGEHNEIAGAIVSKPAAYTGTWQILVGAHQTVTVVVTENTLLQHFERTPRLNEWVEVRGATQPDGSVLAERLRPSRFASGEVIVRLRPGFEILAILNLFNLQLIDTLLSSANIYLLGGENIDEQGLVATLLQNPAVLWAEVNYIVETPADPEGSPYRTWKWGGAEESGYIHHAAFEQVHLPASPGIYSGAGVTVAVLDTGIDATHPAFAGRLLPGRDVVSNDSNPQDGPEAGQPAGLAQGHGTHVSGIVTRIAPQSKILPVRVLDANGRGDVYRLAYAVDWAADEGAGVINLSLGAESPSYVLRDAIAAAAARDIVLVAAAGNNGDSEPQYPASFPGVLGVTAVDEFDHKADFASYGAGWVDLAAPGIGITSTVPVSPPVLYAAWSGTSIATPFAAGAAALARQQTPTASAAEVAGRLIATGRELDASNPQYTGMLGSMLDISAALGIAIEEPVSSTLYLPTITTQ